MSGASRVVLDTSTGGPLHPVARAALDAAADAAWTDPTMPTRAGRRAADLLAASRLVLAAGVGAAAESTRLESGGGPAIAAGLVGLLTGVQTRSGSAPRLVVSSVEHSAALRVARWWAAQGHDVMTVPVDRLGRIDQEALVGGAGPGTVACVQLANGEVGTDQGAEETLRLLAERGAATLLDATAAVGRVPIPGGWSAVAAAATSWGGPRGTGVLGWSSSGPWRAPAPDLADERPVGLAVAAAAVLEHALDRRETGDRLARDQIARIRAALPSLASGIDIAGDPLLRLPHVLTVSALYCDGESLALALDRRGVAVGSGSACASDSGEPSHVLAAMGALTGGNVRLVLPVDCPDDAIDAFLGAYPEAIEEVRAL